MREVPVLAGTPRGHNSGVRAIRPPGHRPLPTRPDQAESPRQVAASGAKRASISLDHAANVLGYA
jgi:hypothetical protein